MRIHRSVIQNGVKYSKTILQLNPNLAVILIDNEHSVVCIKIIIAEDGVQLVRRRTPCSSPPAKALPPAVFLLMAGTFLGARYLPGLFVRPARLRLAIRCSCGPR